MRKTAFRMMTLIFIGVLILVMMPQTMLAQPDPEGFCDGICDPGDESLCPEDCAVVVAPCGNGNCEAGESCMDCPEDCGPCFVITCGDGICDGGDSCLDCPQDCGPCLDIH
jgi:hypothetical protein